MEDVSSSIRDECLRFVRENKNLKLSKKVASYLSPRISSEYMDCSMPMTFDSYSHCSLGCAYCCLEGTVVDTSVGKKPIEDMEIGDIVYSRNIISGQIVLDNVLSVMERTVDEIIQITLEDGTELNITKEHPIYVKEYGWIDAGELEEGDDLDISKRPDASRYMRKDNLMSNPKIAKKQGLTMKKKI